MDLLTVNGWSLGTGGRYIDNDKQQDKFLQQGQRILLPEWSIKLMTGTLIYELNQQGHGRWLEKESLLLERSNVDVNAVAETIAQWVNSSGNLIPQLREIHQKVFELEGDASAIFELQEAFRKQMPDITLQQAIHKKRREYYDEFVWRSMSVEDRACLRGIQEALQVKEFDASNFLSEKEEQGIKEEENLMPKVKFWDGLNAEQLADRAFNAINKASSQKQVVDQYELFSALASLRLHPANIVAFKQAYQNNYGGEIIDNLKDLTRLQVGTQFIPQTVGLTCNNVSNRVPLYAFSNDSLATAMAYLTARDYDLHGEGVKELTDQFQVNTDQDWNLQVAQLPNGSYVKFQHSAEGSPLYAYVVQAGDSLSALAAQWGITIDDLKYYNPSWEEIDSRGMITHYNGVKAILRVGQVIHAPAEQVYAQSLYYHLINGRLRQIQSAAIRVNSLGDLQIDAGNYQPEDFAKILKSLYHEYGGGSLTFNLAVYLEGRALLVLYLRLTARSMASLEQGYDLGITATTSLKGEIEGGLDLYFTQLRASKSFKIMGKTHAYDHIDHFAAALNHDLYVALLGNGAYLPKFIQYFDDEDVRKNAMTAPKLIKNQQEPNLSATYKDSGLGNNSSMISSHETLAPGYIGQKVNRTNSKNQSAEFANAAIVSNYQTNFGPLDITYSNIAYDANKDNNGQYLTFSLEISLDDLFGLLKDMADLESLKTHLKTFKDQISKTKDGVANLAQNIKKTVGQIQDLLKGQGLFTDLLSLLGKSFNGLGQTLLALPNIEKDWFKSAAKQNYGAFQINKKNIFEKYQKKQIANNQLHEAQNKKANRIGGDLSINFNATFVLEKGQLIPQFYEIGGRGTLDIKAKQTLWQGGYGSLAGGMDFQAEYERVFHIEPATDTLSYISTIYNAYVSGAMAKGAKDQKDQFFEKIQQERNNKGYKSQEAEKYDRDMMKAQFWDPYQAQNPTYASNPQWEHYKKEHQGSLEKIIENFFRPIKENAEVESWEEMESELMTISADDAGYVLGKGGPKGFWGERNIKGGFIDMKKFSIEEFEKMVLYPLFHLHQQYDFYYFNYTTKK